MVTDIETKFFRDQLLALFNFLINEFRYRTAAHADQVIMVDARFQLEHRPAFFKMVPDYQARGFELGQHPVDSRQPDFIARIDQGPVNILGAQMMPGILFKDGQNPQAGLSCLETGFFEFATVHDPEPR